MTYLGESIPKLGFGAMRLPKKGDAIDLDATKQMVDQFMAAGFTYFDTAFNYMDGNSEGAIGEALVKRYPRESFQLATKLPVWKMKSAADMRTIFETSLARTGAGYFDYYLLHNLDFDKTALYEKYGAWDFVRELKAAGKIRHFGFSIHDTAARLDEVLTAHPEAEFVQLQINYADWESSAVQSRRCFEVAQKHGKPVIIMEPVKGGALAELTPAAAALLHEADPAASAASWAVRFCASLPGLITVLSGMSSPAQMEDNLRTMQNFRPLDERERALLGRVAELLQQADTIPCTNCRYCIEDCPEHIKIPMLLHIMNELTVYQNKAAAQNNYTWECTGAGKASACRACNNCVERCPQHLDIPRLMVEAADLFE